MSGGVCETHRQILHRQTDVRQQKTSCIHWRHVCVVTCMKRGFAACGIFFAQTTFCHWLRRSTAHPRLSSIATFRAVVDKTGTCVGMTLARVTLGEVERCFWLWTERRTPMCRQSTPPHQLRLEDTCMPRYASSETFEALSSHRNHLISLATMVMSSQVRKRAA